MLKLQVFSETYKTIKGNVEGTFLIDSTLGRNAKFQMDFITTNFEKISIIFPDGSPHDYTSITTSPFIAKFDFLEVYLIQRQKDFSLLIKIFNVMISSSK